MRLPGLLLACLTAACAVAPDDAPETAITDDGADLVADRVADRVATPRAAGTQRAADAAGDADVTLFRKSDVYFRGPIWDGGPVDNKRQIDAQVSLPTGRYQSVTLKMALSCPFLFGCDWWDRHGHISLVQGTGDGAREIELMRFVTPYRKPMTVSLDVTDLAPLLSGPATVRVFIDTWVGPFSTNGGGWLVDASLAYRTGTPPREVAAVLPLWAPQGVVYGDPARAAERTASVEIPAGVTAATLWTNVTGHGQGNADQCAEFCPRTHRISVDGTTVSRRIWRDDCLTTAVPDQPGTWTLDRAGWCPGALVNPWLADVTVTAGASTTVRWAPDDYVNSCRPDSAECRGCTLGTGCNYDGNSHTEPYYQLSSLLVLYR